MNRTCIGIAGCGALGSLFAARFNSAGMNVHVYDTDSRTISSIEKNGLLVTAADGTVSSHKIAASSDPEILSRCDTIFLFVKTYNLESCLERIKRYLEEGAILVSLQNGIGNNLIMERFINPENIIFGTTAMGATLLGPGSVRTGGSGPAVIGGFDRSEVEKVHSILETAGFDVIMTDNPVKAVWEKAIINSAINPLGAIFNVPNGRLIENEDILSFQKDLVSEACNVAQAAGIDLVTDDMIQKTKTVCEKTATNICSMLQDIRAGRKTEIDSINGAIVREGASHGMPCPVHTVTIRIIHGLESGNNQMS